MIFDIAAAVFAVVFSVYMMKKGGMKAVLSLASFVLSVIIASSCYPVMTQKLYDTPLYETIKEKVYEKIAENGEEDELESIDAMPGFVRNSVLMNVDEAIGNMKQKIAENIANLILKAICFVLAVIATKIILALLIGVLDLCAKLPVIRQLNGLVGFCSGAVVSVLVVWIASCVIGVMATGNETCKNIAEESYVIDFMSNISPF